MIPPGRPMDRETLKAVERELHEQLAKLRKEYKGQPKQYGLGCCDGFAMAIKPIEQMLEQLRDAAPRGEEPPIELTDDMIHQMLGEAEAAYNRARSDAGGSGEGHRVQHEFGKFAKAETVRSYLFQAGILPAPVGRQTPTDPPQTSRSELMRHAVQRGGRPMDVAAQPAPVGGQTPTEPPYQEIQDAPVDWRETAWSFDRAVTMVNQLVTFVREGRDGTVYVKEIIDARWIHWLRARSDRLWTDVLAREAAAPPPPGAPPAFTPPIVSYPLSEDWRCDGCNYPLSSSSPCPRCGETKRTFPTEGRQETR